MRANRSKLAPARKSPRPVSCKHPLNPERVIGSVHTPARPRCHSTLVAGHDRRQSDSDTVQVPEYTWCQSLDSMLRSRFKMASDRTKRGRYAHREPKMRTQRHFVLVRGY